MVEERRESHVQQPPGRHSGTEQQLLSTLRLARLCSLRRSPADSPRTKGRDARTHIAASAAPADACIVSRPLCCSHVGERA
jgi:hypothetical protein